MATVESSATVLYSTGENQVPEGLYAAVLAANSGLVVLNTPRSEAVIEYMQIIARRQGQSIYSWSKEMGLGSLREDGIYVPGSQRPLDAVRYVLQSNHFGIYVFPNATPQFCTQVAPQLRQIARSVGNPDRRVVLMAPEVKLPSGIASLASHLEISEREVPRLRLRDGRWVV